ncbi:MAG TPA: tetraacyldisaccharide 4'-kinase [Nevskia sp.]|nr:tetraacyldisaccharide 4'-kinase [Nevskia sp.]
MKNNPLDRIWYSPSAPSVLRPLASLYGKVAADVARRRKAGAVQLPAPVIVVGNITVGGTGKTPFVLWLVERLIERGWRPGVISRGYGGCAPQYPLRVSATTDPAWSGDEPALIARRTEVPVAVAPDRVAAARLLLDAGEADILVTDDGLQHYRLGRDLEICVVDGSRGLGNGQLLPAGPLREPPARLREVDLVVVNGGGWRPEGVPALDMQLETTEARPLGGGAPRPLASFAGARVNAVAGIGNPERFFASLRAAGIEVVPHPFPDHHRYTDIDLAFDDRLPLLMTEKDAVKCAALAQPHHWYVPAQARIAAEGAALVQQLLDQLPLHHRPQP